MAYGDNERSSLWGVSAFGALAGGGIYAAMKHGQAFKDAFTAGSQDISYASSKIASGASRFAQEATSSYVPNPDAIRNTISNLGASGGLKVNQLKGLGYNSLMSGGKMTHTEAMTALSALDQYSSIEDASASLMSVISSNSGSVQSLESELSTLGKHTGIFSGATTSGGIEGLVSAQPMRAGDLSKGQAARLASIKGSFADAFTGIENGAGVTWEGIRSVEDTIGGKTKRIPMLTGSIEGERFNIPLENAGKTYGGANLSTRYTTRQGYNTAGKLSYADLVTENITNAVRKAGSNRVSLKEGVRQATQSLIDAMNSRDSADRAAAIFSQPEQVMTSGARAKARLISQEALALGVSDTEALNLINQGKMFPYVSPTGAANNLLTTNNLARNLFGDLGGLIENSPELRPGQFVRGEWGVTAGAKARATGFHGEFGKHYSRLDRKIKGAQYDRLMYGRGRDVMSREAYSAPQLMTFYAKQGDVGWNSAKLNQMLSPEQGVISNKVGKMMEYERVISKTVALDAGLEANSTLLAGLQGKKYGEFTPMSIGGGNFVGREMGTGEAIMLSGQNDIPQELIGAELTGPNQAKVYIRDVQRLEKNERWKMFNEGNRYVAQGEDDIGRFLREAGLGRNSVAGQEIEAMFSGKLVARNPLALATQQIEAVSMFAAHKFSGNLPADAAAFLANPSAALGVGSLLEQNSKDASYQIQKSLVGLAKDWGFNKEEMALSFGLMDKGTISRLEQEGTLSPRRANAIRRSSGVIGLDKGRLGDRVVEGGAGNRASIEQGGMRLLSMKGEEGQMFMSDLTGRIQGHGELGAVSKMEASLLNQEGLVSKIGRSSTTENFIDLARENLIQQEGRHVGFGRDIKAFGGASSMYIPGFAEAPTTMNPMIAKGERIESPVARALSDFQYQLQRGAKATEEEVEASAAMLRNRVAAASAEQVSGRGSVFGSAYLGGVIQETNAGLANPMAFRVSKTRAESMYGDLVSRAGSAEEKAFLQGQLGRLNKGEMVQAAMWRHPATGPESMQFVNLAMDTELADNLVAAPYKAGKITMQDGKVLHTDISELVGFKGDFDNDHYNIAAISNRDLNTRLEKKAANMAQDYDKYIFNHYAMKDLIDNRASVGQVMKEASRSAGYQVLGKPKKSTGLVNTALQRFKLAVSAGAPEQYRPLAELFFHMEEAAISKHGDMGVGSLFENISKAASPRTSRDEAVSLMEQSITGLLGPKEDITGSFNGQSYTLNKDPRKWSEQIIDAHAVLREDIDAAQATAKMAKGKGMEASYEEVLGAFNARRASVDPSVAAGQAMYAGSDVISGKGASLVRKTQIKASGFMGALNKAKKPILIGAAAAAGIMLMAPAMSGRIKEGPGGGRNMSSEDFGPPGGQGMMPPPPRQNIAPRVYDLGSGRQTSHANIRMRVNDLNRSSRNFMQSAREMSNGGQVHIRTRDDRSALDARMLANKIQERL